MKKDDEQRRVNEALEDPEQELSPGEIERLSPERKAVFSDQRILDEKLRDALSPLSSRYDKNMSSPEEFRRKLQARIEKSAPAAQDNEFFTRLKQRENKARLKERFVYNPRALGGLATVAALVLVVFSLPVIFGALPGKKKASVAMLSKHKDDSAPHERTRMEAESTKTLSAPRKSMSSAPPVPRKPTAPPESNPNRKERSVAVASGGKKAKSGAAHPGPGMVADAVPLKRGRSMPTKTGDMKTNPGPRKLAEKRKTKTSSLERREKILLQRLKRARSKSLKKKILRELRDVYRKQGRPREMRKMESRIRGL